jgi:radical SAM protein with 4Fe4S-binding SPASM domain
MPTERILDILDQAQALGFGGRIGFHHYSEPLLDARNPMLAREAKGRGMKPYLHTNGDVLKKDVELCEELKRVYDLIVVGLYDYRTNEELEESKRYWSQRLSGVDVRFSYIGEEGNRTARSIGVPRALVPSDTRFTIADLAYPNAPCHRPLIRMIIQYDGEVCNCCEDTHGAFGLGNVYHNSLEELWFSERHVKVIKDLVAGHRERFGLCSICPMSPTGKPPEGVRMSIGPRRHQPSY